MTVRASSADASGPAPARLALVDDHPTLLSGLAAIFADDPAFEVIATGGSAVEAVAIVRNHTPDLIVVDLSMPGDVFSAIDRMAHLAPRLKLVVFTAFANVELALKALDAGAHAFVLKGRPTDDLFDAIAAVLRGELYVSPEFSRRLLSGLKNRTRQLLSAPVRLTTRERQLVAGVLDARTNAELAETLGLTEKMLGHLMAALMVKLRARNRLEILSALQRLENDAAREG